MHLLSRFVHAHLSGLTPHTLSSLFAPLLFHVPCSAPALVAHSAFVRAANATEHLLLAYIRSTSASLAALHSTTGSTSNGQSSRSSHLGISDLPPRLKEWVTGYPRMVASDADLARGSLRAGAKMVACERASRIVRAYSRDLVSSAQDWAAEPDAADWPAWRRVLSTARGEAGQPKYSASYRQLMRVKEVASQASAAGPVEYGASAARALARKQGKKISLGSQVQAQMRDEEQEGRWGSVAGREWSMFEEGGFGSEVGGKLGFDLTESAKLVCPLYRSTLQRRHCRRSSVALHCTRSRC